MTRPSLSTHVLDTTSGKPAAGVAVSLYRGDALAARGTTDADGRISELGASLEPGAYRLVFEVGHAIAGAFFDRVTLDVQLRDGHYHVPLLVSAYGIVSYRGS